MAYEALEFFFVVWSMCIEDGFHLSWINFNSSLSYHKSYKLPCTDDEDTLSRIELHVVCLHKIKCLFHVLDVLS